MYPHSPPFSYSISLPHNRENIRTVFSRNSRSQSIRESFRPFFSRNTMSRHIRENIGTILSRNSRPQPIRENFRTIFSRNTMSRHIWENFRHLFSKELRYYLANYEQNSIFAKKGFFPLPFVTMKNFNESERLCQSLFDSYEDIWHLWTPENHGLIFPDDDSFKTGMNIIGISSRLFPDIVIITFELMTNHLHGTMAGKEQRIKLLFATIKSFLKRKLCADLTNWDCRLRKIESIKDARNVITYNNRNGFLINEDESPYSYPWGANRYFFNPEAKSRFYANCSTFGFDERRKACASHKADSIKDLKKLDGYVSPLSFCDIEAGEGLFRNASHYFYELSKNIESQKKIAEEIGERIFYTDNELFRVVVSLSNGKYNVDKPSLLPRDAKVEVAKTLHYDYNATNKQIIRMLNMDIYTVNALFPD